MNRPVAIGAVAARRVPRIVDIPRARDDQLLHWLALRGRGLSWARVCQLGGGTSPAAVRLACLDVRHADLEWSSEPERVVQRGYR